MFRCPGTFDHVVYIQYVLHIVPLPTTNMKPMYFDNTSERRGNRLKPRSAKTATYFSPNYEATHHWKTTKAASCKFQCHRSSWPWRPSNVRLKPWTMTAEQNECSLWLTFKHQTYGHRPMSLSKNPQGHKTYSDIVYVFVLFFSYAKKKQLSLLSLSLFIYLFIFFNLEKLTGRSKYIAGQSSFKCLA